MNKNKTNWNPEFGEIVYAYDFEHELLNPDIDCRKKFIFEKNGLYHVSELDYENIFGLLKYKHIKQRTKNDYAIVYKFKNNEEYLKFEIYTFNNSKLPSDYILQEVDMFLYINGSKYDKIESWGFKDKDETTKLFEIFITTIGGETFKFNSTLIEDIKIGLK